MKLDLSSLRSALNSLENSINSYNNLTKNFDLSDNDVATLKSGVIQNFEVAFELCWKFIQRWIKENKGPDKADPMTKRELFRMAAASGLIDNPTAWFEHGEERNLTSHTYDGNIADQVFDAANAFINDGKLLLSNLEKRND